MWQQNKVKERIGNNNNSITTTDITIKTVYKSAKKAKQNKLLLLSIQIAFHSQHESSTQKHLLLNACVLVSNRNLHRKELVANHWKYILLCLRIVTLSILLTVYLTVQMHLHIYIYVNVSYTAILYILLYFHVDWNPFVQPCTVSEQILEQDKSREPRVVCCCATVNV